MHIVEHNFFKVQKFLRHLSWRKTSQHLAIHWKRLDIVEWGAMKNMNQYGYFKRKDFSVDFPDILMKNENVLNFSIIP